jgi:pimeloyl-ACP methyl ester carboxylesterase
MHRVRAPGLVVWGAQDGIASPVYADEFKACLASARVGVIEAAGHLPHLEQPERVLAEIFTEA